MGKIFAVGDIHGCHNEFEKLLDRLPLDPENDTLVLLGDYVDRGPRSCAVVERVLELKAKLKNIHCLMGNHEEMLLNFLQNGYEAALFLANGGIQTLESYGLKNGNKGGIPPEHGAFFSSLETYYETEQYIFVHAGMRPGIDLAKQTSHDLLWIRREFIAASTAFDKIVIFGHTPFALPFISPSKIGIDTGCVYGNQLTAIELPEMKFYSIPKEK